MIKPNKDTFTPEALLLGERAYKPEHIEKVMTEIKKNFRNYFKSFSTKSKISVQPSTLIKLIFDKEIADFKNDQIKYKAFFDLETLDEYEDNPNGFKSDFQKKVPIILNCMFTPAKEMQKYQFNFRDKSGRELLDVTRNIINFAEKFIKTFDDRTHEKAVSVSELGLSDLGEEKYISHLVIGGGIKSNFLYSLYPNAFPNRSQSALWSLWYLVNKNKFGFADDSEFLMIHPKEGKTHQNYHYPYDLFSYYALQIYHLLKTACAAEGVTLLDKYRYIYLETFFKHIADVNSAEITDLKKDGEYEE